tara:strand:+ start:7978 stop:9045 length:1068 start_codon:yes stop_codon:yes gene_type:complete
MKNKKLSSLHKESGATLENKFDWDIPCQYSNPTEEHLKCRQDAILIDLSHYGKIEFRGNDASTFLQGMISNDVLNLEDGEGKYGTFLTRQGKIISDLYLYKNKEHFRLLLPPGENLNFIASIEKFIIMEEVEIHDHSESLSMFGVFGPKVEDFLQDFSPLPKEPHQHTTHGNTQIIKELWTGEKGYLLITNNDEAIDLWKNLSSKGIQPSGLNAFESLTLESGLPLFGTELGPDINPMQAFIENEAIDFEKGCYIGQEVIAKIKYIGQVNKGLIGIQILGEKIPKHHSKIFFEDQEVGAITRCNFSPSTNKIIAMGYVQKKAMDIGTEINILSEDESIQAKVVEIPFLKNKENER